MNEFTATCVAILSTMVQADATFIGFGALFIIYKLQLLQNQYERLLTSARAHLTPEEALVLGWEQSLRTPELISEMFKGREAPAVVQLVLANDREAERIRRLAALPFLVLSIHIILTAVQLWLVPILSPRMAQIELPYVGFSLLIFITGIILTVNSAWKMSLKHEDLTLIDWERKRRDKPDF